jgi:hypothetical protein
LDGRVQSPSGREERLARNEASYRELNETMVDAHKHHPAPEELFPFVCECADRDCTQIVHLKLDEYYAVRFNPRRFVIAPGHQVADIEIVLEQSARYAVVQKRGAAGEVAEDETKP